MPTDYVVDFMVKACRKYVSDFEGVNYGDKDKESIKFCSKLNDKHEYQRSR